MRLVYPSEKYLNSYAEAVKEYAENNVTTYFFDDPQSVDVVKKYKDYRHGKNMKPGYVPQTTFWLVDGNEFVGEIGIRHTLNDSLKIRGGHIGYGIRCSRWGKGYGTKMLKLALKKAKAMRLDKVLITCNIDNYASARVIEKNGGILQDIVVANNQLGVPTQTKRYWINLK